MQHDSAPPATALPAPVASAPGWRGWLGRLPRPCALCSQWDRSGLCSACRQRFLAPQHARCPQCALRSPGGARCGRCLHTPPPFQHCIALADYGFPWDRLISRFKFQQQAELAGLLADCLADRLADHLGAQRHGDRSSAVADCAERAGAQAAATPAGPATSQSPGSAGPPPVQWVLPVPLSPARLAERGYNQAWELARRVARRRGLGAQAHWLLRLRDTPHQVGLGRPAREANLRNAMWVPPEGQRGLAGCQVALVDDVMTTGVTAAAATRALLAAGAAGVQVWVLARTPAPGD